MIQTSHNQLFQNVSQRVITYTNNYSILRIIKKQIKLYWK